ncbi:MAG TPA: nucleoside permease [Candidatus Hydrogenedentes bacterium]|nr:nucleoside permease [Candidatus Hydrogenedentota bacterium]HPG70317.1 nucleoside permease [Candidatus Hydrogenedentota bacterium]
MNMRTRVELSVMMFIQFFIWGAWCVTLGAYLGKQGLGFKDLQVANAYSTTAWAAVLSPFFVGMVADRFFPAQIVLGVLHLMGAALLYWVSTITEPAMFFWVLLAYALCYMPTLALVNAISFNQMKDPSTEFPSVRVFGTLGWIIAGLVISYVLGVALKSRLPEGTPVDATNYPIVMAAVASLVMGVYSFLLPNTPPKAKGEKVTISDILGLKALGLMKDRSFLVFVLGSLFICIPLAFYYSFTNMFLNEVGVAKVAGKMTMGQMSEFFFMLVMPFFFARLGVKKMLLVGMAAWAVRYAFFAFGNADSLVFMFYIAILLHGVCYDFFFVTGQIYVDNVAPKEIRANAQGLIALVTYGLGMVIGNFVAGKVVGHYVLEDGSHAWRSAWLIPGGMAVVIILLFAVFFHERKQAAAA